MWFTGIRLLIYRGTVWGAFTCILLFHAPVQAQFVQKGDEWTALYEKAGVKFSFIFYRQGDGANHSGAVIRLENTNPYPVRYHFTPIFRSDSTEYQAEPATGIIPPDSTVTGSSSGLWWVPFRDGRVIRHVGIRGIDIKQSSAADTTSASQPPGASTRSEHQ